MEKFSQIAHIYKITKQKHKLSDEESDKIFNKFYT